MKELVQRILKAVMTPAKDLARTGTKRFLQSKTQKKLKKHTRKLSGKLIRFGIVIAGLGLLIGNLDRILGWLIDKK